jgi:molecular chaperone DnaJ
MNRRDPYQTLGVDARASDAELRAAYRRLVQLHHPDHNHGSAESARRFEEVQEAYAEIRRRRESAAATPPRAGTPPHAPPPPPPAEDPSLEGRLADLERQVRAARDRARREAERARREAERARRRPSDEELGYVHTDDSFSQIISDARDELAHRFADAREHPVVKRVSDLIDGLDELASKLDDRPRRSGSG